MCCYFKFSSEFQNFANCGILATLSPKVSLVLQSVFRCLLASCRRTLNFKTVYMFITICLIAQHWHTSGRNNSDRENSAKYDLIMTVIKTKIYVTVGRG